MAANSFKILAWHSLHVIENDYTGNDQIAFAADLRTLHRHGAHVWALEAALEAMAAGTLPDGVVVLTADDGSILDFLPFEHPTCGPQPGLYAILRGFADEVGPQAGHSPHLSSFVIASPEARAELDHKDYRSLNVWHDAWWPQATASGMVAIENHSWDHCHPSLDRVCQRENHKGDFRQVDTEGDCRAQVDRAGDYIADQAGRRPRFFAYPWGTASDYMIDEYLPRHGERQGLVAALGCSPAPVTRASNPWNLPRYMFNQDWKSEDELVALLRQ